MSASAMFRASSPLSGCETSSSSSFTPTMRAYFGSSACSTSMKAARPPRRWASAMTLRQNVVLPDDSGPKISMIRPRGSPPTPRARSMASEPVEIVSTIMRVALPRRMMEPSPNSLVMAETAISIFLARAGSADRSAAVAPGFRSAADFGGGALDIGFIKLENRYLLGNQVQVGQRCKRALTDAVFSETSMRRKRKAARSRREPPTGPPMAAPPQWPP